MKIRNAIAIAIAIAAAALAFVPSAHAQTIEADNGAVFKIINLIHPDPSSYEGTAQAQIYTPDGELVSLMFDCKGHMKRMDLMGPMTSIPPRSVGGRIGQIACARTHS
jgi:hypothetical protein